jgi:hypothetical protein
MHQHWHWHWHRHQHQHRHQNLKQSLRFASLHFTVRHLRWVPHF